MKNALRSGIHLVMESVLVTSVTEFVPENLLNYYKFLSMWEKQRDSF